MAIIEAFLLGVCSLPHPNDLAEKRTWFPASFGTVDFDTVVFQRSQIMLYAIEEINKDQGLLPNVTLGYRVYDNCINLQVAMRAAATLIGGMDEVSDYDCEGLPHVVAVVGDPISTHSIAISRTLGLFGMPLLIQQVSYCSTCACLSNKLEFPTFFRTVPSDAFLVKVMAEIIKHYKWTWVGIISSDDEYGLFTLRTLEEEVKKFGCIAFSKALNVNDKEKMSYLINIIRQSTATVIVVFLQKMDAAVFVDEVSHHNITGKQWIASDSWSPFPVFASNEKFGSFGGTIGVAARRGMIPGLETFLFQIHPHFDPENNLKRLFWEAMFDCKFLENDVLSNVSAMEGRPICSGSENISKTKTAYSDVSDLRASYNVYKAVYAVAHALHNLMSCETGKGPFENQTCANIKTVQPWQLLHYLKKVNFTNKQGERVAFDVNGDALAIFDIVNWQQSADGIVFSKTIGIFDESALPGQELSLNEENIFWNFKPQKVPTSVCSQSCQPGTRKASRKGEPLCCFDCVPCADGEISSENDSLVCIKCPPDFWSNQRRNQCVPKEVEFLSYEDAMGITLAATALSGVGLSLGVLAIFIRARNTPVVKANNSELSFLLLVSLTLCFLCALCFIGLPSPLTCSLRHVMFGISFVLCISCILVKTIVVMMAFKTKLPGDNMMKWFGTSQQRGTVFFFTLVQSLICLVWLITSPPGPVKNLKYQNIKIIYECDVGTVIGFSCLLGYIGLLACVSFLLAFLVRNLPDTFNEAKFITFSMLIFCAVWITFIPAYISSPGKYTVAVEIFAILASSFGLLFAIFAPKCYIILFKPEQNTKKALMGRNTKKKF
ncbi:extracellular calcium-sensing receptor-like [Erpetoichthys calabaricus]|uniref:extracellular calcium-sensing receptor-like n=1 Tax=Erpetoichthys calabaricus TaxID=27687 RepID=UPI002234BC0B|nr:extracellular calcium-sensing receptor-like [Erpetoichthys calabaricus]